MNTYILYLRKSRQDNPNETVEEVLFKHETILQEYAEKNLGGRITEENIYREVQSGESIDDRIEIKKVLKRIEDPNVKGVLVIEPQRLSRGDLEDCGRLISDLRYTRTEVITPYMTYDLTEKLERKFFQDELLRGRDYLEYTKEILSRGKIASVKRGCYIPSVAPYGYSRIKIGNDHTLEEHPEEADIVRYIFELYALKGFTPLQIAEELNRMGVKPRLKDKWVKSSIRGILSNEHYIGLVVYNKIKETIVVEDGKRKVKRLRQATEDILYAEGLHDAIISKELWDKAQDIIKKNPRVTKERTLQNPLASILRCSGCGGVMLRVSPSKKRKNASCRYSCGNKPSCFKSVEVPTVLEAVIKALEEAELPNLQMKITNDEGNAIKIQKALLIKYEEQMNEYRAQEEKQFDLLETGQYTTEIFNKRNAALREKIDALQKTIMDTRANLPREVDYTERVATLEEAISILKDSKASAKDQNNLLKSIIESIEYTGEKNTGFKGRTNPFSLNVFLRL